MKELLDGLGAWSILDQIVLYCFIVLFFWGGTNKFGRKLEFNDDYTSLEIMK